MKLELARATLPHIRDPSDFLVEMALRHEELLDSLEKSKANEVLVEQGQKMKLFLRKVLRRVEQLRKESMRLSVSSATRRVTLPMGVVLERLRMS